MKRPNPYRVQGRAPTSVGECRLSLRVIEGPDKLLSRLALKGGSDRIRLTNCLYLKHRLKRAVFLF